MKRLATLLSCAFFCSTAQADYSNHPKTPQLLTTLSRDFGFTAAQLSDVRDALRDAQQIPALIEAEQKSAEKTETWTTYATKRVDPLRIQRGVQFLRDNRDRLAQAETEYGVPPAVIAGVIGLETNFGRITGNARVLDSLATQGFEHPTRSPFFFSELTQYFVFCRDFGFKPGELKGSYAGAMGWAQFMPSNYRRLAVDFDNDGRKDLWSSADAIGSIGHYFNGYDPKLAWQRGEPLAVAASLQKPLANAVLRNTRNVTHTVASLKALGIVPSVELPPNTPVGLIELNLDDGKEYWLGLRNFYSVLSYNPRVFYAMTVTRLSQEMELLDMAAAR